MLSEKYKYPIILAILSVILYANTLSNDYVMDDGQVIVNNKLIAKGISAIPELLTTSRLKGYGPVENDTYRPIPMIAFAIEHQIWGNSPAAGHLFNILFFAACVMVLFLFLSRLLRNDVVAFVASLLFAVHPIHTEVVANIKSRDELLCFLFAISSLNAFLSYTEKRKVGSLIAGSSLFFLSLLSKETSATFIALIPLIFFFFTGAEKKSGIHIAIAAIVPFVIFLAARDAALQSGRPAGVVFMSNPLVSAPDFPTRLATALLGLGLYLKLLFIPHPLICDYSYNTIPLTDFQDKYAVLSLLVYVALTITGVYRLRKNPKDIWAFGILFFLLTIALFSNIPFLVYSQFAERFLFFPSVGFCIVVAVAINKWLIRSEGPGGLPALMKPAALGLLIPLVLALGYLTYARNTDWKSNTTLYLSDAPKAPENGWLSYNAGNTLITNVYDREKDPRQRQQVITDAVTYLSRAVSTLPDHPNAAAQLSYAYTKAKMPDSAKVYAIKALRQNPDNIVALTSLGALFYETRDYNRAIVVFKKVLSLKPDYVLQYSNIGLSYLRMEQFDSGIAYMHLALEHVPANKTPYGNIAIAYQRWGKPDSAMKYEQITKQYFPKFSITK